MVLTYECAFDFNLPDDFTKNPQKFWNFATPAVNITIYNKYVKFCSDTYILIIEYIQISSKKGLIPDKVCSIYMTDWYKTNDKIVNYRQKVTCQMNIEDTILPLIGVKFHKSLLKIFGKTLETNSRKRLLFTIIENTKPSPNILPLALLQGKLIQSFLTPLSRKQVWSQ